MYACNEQVCAAVTLYTCIRDVFRSNLGRVIACPDRFSSVSPANVGVWVYFEIGHQNFKDGFANLRPSAVLHCILLSGLPTHNEFSINKLYSLNL